MRKKYIFLAIVFALILFRLYLPVLVLHYVNEKLNKDPEYRGSVADVGLQILRGSYSLTDLKIERVEGQKIYPLVSARQIIIGLSWPELLNGAILAQVTMIEPRINVVLEEEKKTQVRGSTKAERKREEKTWQQTINDLIPLKIGMLTATNGEFYFHDFTANPKFDLFVDQLNVESHNLTNSTKNSKSLFATLVAQGRAMKSGDIKVKIFFNPLSSPPDMKLELTLKNLNLVELNKFFIAYGKFDVKKGEFGLYCEIATEQQKIAGYFKPLVTDLEVSNFTVDREKGLGHAIWEKMVGALGGILKNYSKNQQAAKIEFTGKLSSPDFELWPTITSIFKNIFIEALQPKLDGGVSLKDLKKNKK